ncbi:hypothetical protein NW762_002185 [Fusarium torreyae]|uniref:Uncharacterized protein n=1 Tax=Fusarium torreyae TaxID=1237075 RepID=A0A9W8VKI8_9HYPO|nr:hypothetical protein NW762_002185 [Fusarium torreyae]
MRGLAQAAAVVLSPALALAHGPHHPPPPPPPPPMGFLPSALDVTPSAFVTVKVPWSETESYPLTLRFDVEESEEICGPASIKLNGEPLSQDAKGHGVGSFLVNNETVISADWEFECIGPKEFPFGQSMKFNVKALDDMALAAESSFWMTFKQTAPVRISDVGNAAYVWSLSMPFSSKEKDASSEEKPSANSPPSIWEYPDREFQDPEEELQVELMELTALHKQILQLEELVKEREASVSKKLGKKYPPPPPSTLKKIKACDGVQCVLHTVGDKIRHSTHKFYNSVFGPGHGPHHGPHHGHHGPHHKNGTHPPHGPPHGDHPPPPPPPPPPHHGPPPFPFPGGHPPPPMCAPCPCDPHHGNPPPPPHHGGKHHDGPHHDGLGSDASMAGGHEGHPPPPPPPPHHPIVMILGIAAIALALFCGIAIAYLHRRVARLSPESRRAIRRAFRQSREERRKGSALKAAYRAFVSRWVENDEDEKEAMLQGDRRRRASSGSSVTMEEEIAQFRQAAQMVEGIVAAEEGREHHHSHSYSSYAAGPPVPPRPSHYAHATAYPGFVDSDENLPSYDDDEHDSSVVADGCRYTPGSSDYTPSNNGSNASDVLGDTKN